MTSEKVLSRCVEKEEEEEGKGGIFQSVTKWRQYEPFIQTVTLGVTWDTQFSTRVSRSQINKSYTIVEFHTKSYISGFILKTILTYLINEKNGINPDRGKKNQQNIRGIG